MITGTFRFRWRDRYECSDGRSRGGDDGGEGEGHEMQYKMIAGSVHDFYFPYTHVSVSVIFIFISIRLLRLIHMIGATVTALIDNILYSFDGFFHLHLRHNSFNNLEFGGQHF